MSSVDFGLSADPLLNLSDRLKGLRGKYIHQYLTQYFRDELIIEVDTLSLTSSHELDSGAVVVRITYDPSVYSGFNEEAFDMKVQDLLQDWYPNSNLYTLYLNYQDKQQRYDNGYKVSSVTVQEDQTCIYL